MATAQRQHAADLHRTLLEVARERSAAVKLQKKFDQARRVLADQGELHRQQLAERQQQAEGLRQRDGELEGTVAELRSQLERSRHDLENLRLRVTSPVPLKPVRARKTMKPTSSGRKC